MADIVGNNNHISPNRPPSANSVGGSSAPGTPGMKRKESTLSNVVEGENHLGLEVFKRQSSLDLMHNMVQSPKSYCSALHLVGLGAWGKIIFQLIFQLYTFHI